MAILHHAYYVYDEIQSFGEFMNDFAVHIIAKGSK